MKFICKVEAVKEVAPEMFCIAKKQELTQSKIGEFMRLSFVSDEERETLRAYIKEQRATSNKKYMTQVRDKFIEMFYTPQEKPKERKERIYFEDKF